MGILAKIKKRIQEKFDLDDKDFIAWSIGAVAAIAVVAFMATSLVQTGDVKRADEEETMNGWTPPSEAEIEVHEILTPEPPIFETQDD